MIQQDTPLLKKLQLVKQFLWGKSGGMYEFL